MYKFSCSWRPRHQATPGASVTRRSAPTPSTLRRELAAPKSQWQALCAAQRSARSSTLPARAAARARAAPKRELERDGTAPATWEMPPRRDASASGGEGAACTLSQSFSPVIESMGRSSRVAVGALLTRLRACGESIVSTPTRFCSKSSRSTARIESIDSIWNLYNGSQSKLDRRLDDRSVSTTDIDSKL